MFKFRLSNLGNHLVKAFSLNFCANNGKRGKWYGFVFYHIPDNLYTAECILYKPQSFTVTQLLKAAMVRIYFKHQMYWSLNSSK